MDAPDDTRIIVFKRGTFIGLNGSIRIGGHWWPSSRFGEMLEWKKDQNNEEKNKISDVIKRIIPIFKFFIEDNKCHPCINDSRETSRHQEIEFKIIIVKIRK